MSEAPAPVETNTPANVPIVDPSPAQAPIMVHSDSLEDQLKAHPAPASPPEVLELKPNRYEDAVGGPHPQVSAIGYTTWTKPDGSSFVAPVANDETYARKGFTKGATEDIPDLVAYLAERAQRDPSATKPKSSKSS